MKKQTYIKPDTKAYQIIPSKILANSETTFGSGGSGDPNGGRVKGYIDWDDEEW